MNSESRAKSNIIAMADAAGLPESRVRISEFQMIPPCVYFLMRGRAVVYVGKTRSLYRRVEDHWYGNGSTPVKDFDSFSYIEVESEKQDFVEARFILLLQPSYNKQLHTKGGRTRLVNLAGDDWVRSRPWLTE